MLSINSHSALLQFKVSKVFKPSAAQPNEGAPRMGINSLSFHERGDLLATGSNDESIRLYDCNTGKLEKEIFSRKYGVDLVRFTHHPQNLLYASKNEWDQSIRLLSIHDNKYLRYFKGHRDTVTCLALSPKDDFFMSASRDGTIRLWDTNTSACQGLLRRNQTMSVVGFDPEGKVFAVACGNEQLKLFDIRNYDSGPFAAWEIHSKGISHFSGLEFSKDGKFILLTSNTDYIKLIDAYEGTEIGSVSGYQSSGCVAKFSPDSKFFFFGTLDRKILSYEVPSDPLGGREKGQNLPPSLKKVRALESKNHDGPIGVVDWNPTKAMLASGCKFLNLWIPEANDE